MTPTVNTNNSLLKAEDTTLTKVKNKPVVSKRRTKSRFKAKSLTEVISTRSKNKSKTTIENIPQNTRTKIEIKVLTGKYLLVLMQKPHTLLKQNTNNRILKIRKN